MSYEHASVFKHANLNTSGQPHEASQGGQGQNRVVDLTEQSEAVPTSAPDQEARVGGHVDAEDRVLHAPPVFDVQDVGDGLGLKTKCRVKSSMGSTSPTYLHRKKSCAPKM